MNVSNEMPEWVKLAIGGAILLLIAGAVLIHSVRNFRDPYWRRNMVQLVIGVVALTVILPAWIYYHSKSFHGWNLAGALVAQVFLFVLICYSVRWTRYPGIYQSQSKARLTAQVFLFTLFVLSIPLLAVILWIASHLFVAFPMNLKRIAVRLGMSFKHGRGDVISFHDSPELSASARVGRIRNIRVVSQNELSTTPEPVGTVIYEVACSDGFNLEVPEHRM